VDRPGTPGLDPAQVVAARHPPVAGGDHERGERLGVSILPEVATLFFGRNFRCDTLQSTVYGHGVLAADAQAALVAYVQLDEQVPEPEQLLIPGLPAYHTYLARQLLPTPGARPWPGEGLHRTGAALATIGLP